MKDVLKKEAGLLELGEALLEVGNGFVEGAREAASGSIEVTSPAPVGGGKAVAGEDAHATERGMNHVLLRILAQEGGETDVAYLQGEVDEALGVALVEPEAFHLGTREGDERGFLLGEETHLLVEGIAHHAQAPLGVVVEDATVDVVLVDAVLEQTADDVEDVGTVAVEGEGARVGHHAAIEAGGCLLAQVRLAVQGFDEGIDELAGGRGIGLAERELAEAGLGVEVMVDEHAMSLGLADRLLHVAGAAGGVEVHADDDVGSSNREGGLVGVFVGTDGLLSPWQPAEEVGIHVGHDHHSRLALLTQPVGQAEGGTHRIAVGVGVADKGKELVFGYQRSQPLDIGLREGEHLENEELEKIRNEE